MATPGNETPSTACGENNEEASDRMKILAKPRVGTASPKRRRKYWQDNRDQERKKVKNTPKKTRYAGRLSGMFGLPMDIFFEVTSKLEPLDILQLSRVSKHFRSLFMASSSRHIWVAARRNIPRLPECPPDLNEAQYAYLLFDKVCFACGRQNAQVVDYALRVRFCSSCFKQNVRRGSKLARSLRITRPSLPNEVYTLIPRAIPKVHRWWGWASSAGQFINFTNMSNSDFHDYYAPEFEMVVTKYRALQPNQPALYAFVKAQQKMASQMMVHGQSLSEWADTSKKSKTDEDSNAMKRRHASIEAKLLDLGWGRDSYPLWDAAWDAMFNQPRDLTPRIWNSIRPKLEAILREWKELLLTARREARHNEFREVWNSFLESTPADERRYMPDYVDAVYLPTVAAMIAEADSELQITKERWDTFSESVMLEVEQYQLEIKRDLVALLNRGDTKTEVCDTPHDNDEDFQVLSKPSSLFFCLCDKLLGYPAVMHHEHLHAASCGLLPDMLRYEPQLEMVVAQVLKASYLPDSVTLSDLENLGERFVCLCGHPRFRTPMSFAALVRHIFQENKWYLSMLEGAQLEGINSSLVLYNDHNLDDPNPRFFLLENDNLSDQPDLDILQVIHSTLCPICVTMFSKHEPLSYTYDEITYHITAKHQANVSSILDVGDILQEIKHSEPVR